MAQLPQSFNTNTDEEMNDFSALRAGWYPASIIKSELKNCSKNAKDPNGKYLAFRFKILSGTGKGSMFFTNVNIINKNPDAVAMANKEMNTLRKVVGKPKALDTNELHGIPLLVKVSLVPPNEEKGWGAKNEIKMYAKYDASKISFPVAGQSDPGFGKDPANTTEPEDEDDGDEMPWDDEED